MDSSENLPGVAAEILYENELKSESSGEEIPMDEWSSLSGLNNPSDFESTALDSSHADRICAAYIRQSDSSVLRHPYYNYPAVLDPGIRKALLDPEPVRPPYPDDGVQLYMDLCEELNICPIRLFQTSLLSPEINLKYYCPDSANVRIMAMALQHNKNVKRLDLSDNYLDLDSCYHLGQMISANTTLQELILDGCRIREQGLRQLGAKMNRNVTLKTISLARNDLDDIGGALFAEILGSGANFTKINLSCNKLGVKTAYALARAIMYTNKITHLNLSWNTFVHIASAVKFFNTLSESETLQELNLSFMGFDNERIAEAIAGLTQIKTLKILDISNNRFSDETAEILVSKLPGSKLNTYNLSNNVFTPTGACEILLIMTRPTVKLQNLYLDNTCVNRNFMKILNTVKKMKMRKNFVVTFDRVLHDWVAVGDDLRRLVLRRGEYMGKMSKKAPKDVPMFLLSLSHTVANIRAKELTVMMKDQKIPVNDDWIAGLIQAFPGPIVENKPTVDAIKMREYMRRIWPDLKLPPNWKPPVMIRVDVKNKKKVEKSASKMALKSKKR